MLWVVVPRSHPEFRLSVGTGGKEFKEAARCRDDNEGKKTDQGRADVEVLGLELARFKGCMAMDLSYLDSELFGRCQSMNAQSAGHSLSGSWSMLAGVGS